MRFWVALGKKWSNDFISVLLRQQAQGLLQSCFLTTSPGKASTASMEHLDLIYVRKTHFCTTAMPNYMAVLNNTFRLDAHSETCSCHILKCFFCQHLKPVHFQHLFFYLHWNSWTIPSDSRNLIQNTGIVCLFPVCAWGDREHTCTWMRKSPIQSSFCSDRLQLSVLLCTCRSAGPDPKVGCLKVGLYISAWDDKKITIFLRNLGCWTAFLRPVKNAVHSVFWMHLILGSHF